MNFTLKIVEGPNKGAEIALPEGVAVTLGKGDDSDVVLADATLPDAALTLMASPDGVTLDGEPLEPFAVSERGATAFAVGPSDAPWGELKWPERVESKSEVPESAGPGFDSSGARPADVQPSGPRPSDPRPPAQAKRGRPGLFAALALLLVALVALCWIFRDRARPYAERAISGISGMSGDSAAADESGQAADTPAPLLRDLAERYGLVVDDNRLIGDFSTRTERLVVTAQAYAANPGVELDFCDDESLRTAAEDTIALVGEWDLRVEAATNRILVLSGTAADLGSTLEALSTDLPKLRDVDSSLVAARLDGADAGLGRRGQTPRQSGGKTASLPICGILTTPYPCLVLKSGARVMEGAPIGDSVVLKIEADSVTLTNAAGRIVWKP